MCFVFQAAEVSLSVVQGDSLRPQVARIGDGALAGKIGSFKSLSKNACVIFGEGKNRAVRRSVANVHAITPKFGGQNRAGDDVYVDFFYRLDKCWVTLNRNLNTWWALAPKLTTLGWITVSHLRATVIAQKFRQKQLRNYLAKSEYQNRMFLVA